MDQNEQAGPFFSVQNRTGKPDSEVYVAVTGTNTTTNHIQHLSWTDRRFQDISLNDNDPGNKGYFSSYCISLDKAYTMGDTVFRLEQEIKGARLWVSIGSPLSFKVNSPPPDHPKDPLGLAQPNVNNPDDPNVSTLFDWLEFAHVPDTAGSMKLTANTTCTDFFALSLQFAMFKPTGLFGIRGFAVPRTTIMQALQAIPLLNPLITPRRAFSPETDNAVARQFPMDYFDSYRDYCWNFYKNNDLTILGIVNGKPIQASGRVNADQTLVLVDTANKETHTIALPRSKEIFACNGVFQPAGDAKSGTFDRNGYIKNEVASALNRGVMHLHFMDWRNTTNYYVNTLPEADKSRFKVNIYSQALHSLAIDHKIYGYAWDDKYNQDPTISIADTARLTLIMNEI